MVAVVLIGWLWRIIIAGLTRDFDAGIMLAMRQPSDLSVPRGPEWLFQALRDITALGDTPVLTLVTSIAVGLALTRRQVIEAAFIALTIAFGAIIDAQLKLTFARPRPAVVPHLVEVTSASFPSGHAMNSAVVCLTLAALLVGGGGDRNVRVYIVLVGIALTLVIGMSRIYLGVHYPTDVIAGWLAGAAWTATCWLVAARWLMVGNPAPLASEALPLVVHPAKPRRP